MLSSDKRANLDSAPRGLKETEAGGDRGGGPAPAASLVALPRRSGWQRVMASLDEAGTAAKEPSADPPAGTADEIGMRDSVLVGKGDASASGFRPWYWTYERDGSPSGSDSAGSVTCFPASAPPPVGPSDPVSAPATLSKPRRRAAGPALIAGCSALALITGAGFFFLSRAAPSVVANPPPVLAAPADGAAPPMRATPTTVATPAPVVTPPEMAELMARGEQMLATGDIAAARLFFERAAEAGNAAAAAAAGKTYDPLFLADTHARGIRGDPVAAARWYRRASAGGDREADGLMRRLMAKYAG